MIYIVQLLKTIMQMMIKHNKREQNQKLTWRDLESSGLSMKTLYGKCIEIFFSTQI